MTETSSSRRRPGRPNDSRRVSVGLRRALSLPLLGCLTAAILLGAPALASADSASTLTIVGTSDVSDSGLSANVMQPAFKAAFPQFSYHYIGSATGTAINSAKSGSQGASVLIVHAASLENQFVAGGFSKEPFGRAIFTNDFVLAGPTGDPAGVAANGAHNIAQAFADVAAAGIPGGASPAVTFVSRGGTPGTTVEEHQIWQIVDSSGLAAQVPGLLLCTVDSSLGGGETPIAPGNSKGVTANGQLCSPPTNPPSTPTLPSGNDLPQWYAATGLTQGPNVVAANTCTTFHSPANNSCYVFTDRGTYDYLISGLDPAGTISLVVSTRDDDASAPGGANLLTNYFHAYIINPTTVPGANVNLTAATDFVNMLTTPAFQAQLRTYLNSTTDPDGAPFKPSASPTITASGLPSVVSAGHSVTVSGTVSQPQPGFPAVAGKPVTISEIEGGLPVRVASGTTNGTGGYSISFVPGSSGSYQVSTGQIQMIEDPSLNPVFGDLLSPGAASPMSTSVQSAVSIGSVHASTSGVTVSGSVAPAAPDANGSVTILARRRGATGAFTQIGGGSLAAGQSAFAATGGLQAGAWQVEATYQDPGQLLKGTSGAVNVTVPAPKQTPTSPNASFKKLKVKNGVLTLSGSLARKVTGSGARVELLALRTVKVKKTGKKKATRAGAVARTAAVSFHQVGKTNVRNGKKTFTIKAKLKRGYRWVLQIEFVQKGHPTTFSKLRTLDVH